MDFKRTRVKQIITALEGVKKSFQQLESEKADNIRDFYLMSIENQLNMVEDYLNSLNNYQVDDLDKLQADYNNLLARYRGLQQRHNNLVENIRESEEVEEGQEQTRFSQFNQSELNSIALALEAFNRDYKGIMNETQYKKLMNEIQQQEESNQ